MFRVNTTEREFALRGLEMASTILSSGVRNNLLTLQQTTAEQGVIQNRLATGKRVNSAIDNPVNYFTSLALNDRSSQLNGLLDGISNGIQTIQAASKGIDAIVKLVQSAQSTMKQAQGDIGSRPTVTSTAAIGWRHRRDVGRCPQQDAEGRHARRDRWAAARQQRPPRRRPTAQRPRRQRRRVRHLHHGRQQHLHGRYA